MTYLSDDPTAGLVIATTTSPAVIVVDGHESLAVRRAGADLARDLATVCPPGADPVAADPVAADPEVADPADGLAVGTIVVGTVGVSAAVDAAIASGDLDVSGLLAADGNRHWEGFLLQTVGECLYIVGADRRGTVFGVYDLCETMGVSPWWWFADVPVRPRPHVTVCRGTLACDHPSVRYRGIFINDEEELDAWARAHTDDGGIGPQTYARVFELLLRLKANLIWPAMHVNAFNADRDNGRLAHEMGIIVGTSHCDMLLRSNQNEWLPWLAARGEHAEYDYSMPGRNRELLREYWRGSVEQNAGYEVGWTVGMRGVHDSGFSTSAIDTDPTLTPADQDRARVALLGKVIADQRDILVDVLGPERGRDCLQTFVPYKEVLPLYDAGLAVPEDVTVIWADDNFGYIRRFPDARERARPGGNGLYYHSSYWSQPPRSYLFISSMPLAHLNNELGKAYDRGIRTLWVDNIGAIKPLELDMEFFLRCAWEAGAQTTTADPTAFTAAWIDRAVSGGHGTRAAEINDAFAQITNVRKIEHLDSRAFSQTAFGDEGGRRLAALRDLYDATGEILETLPPGQREAFFQLLALKVHASYLVNAQFYYADRSTLAYEQGKWPAADHYLALSRRFDAAKRALIHYYNATMCDGKWDGILTPESFPPPTTALFPAARPALRIGAPGLGVVLWGQRVPVDRPRLTFAPYGTATKWIEVFNTGTGVLAFTLTADDWIDLDAGTGGVEVEVRIPVRVDPCRHQGRVGHIVVHSPTDDRTVTIEVAVDSWSGADPKPAAWVEADGYVSVPAAAGEHSGPQSSGPQSSGWRTVGRLGRGGGDLIQASGAGTPRTGGVGALSYPIHLTTAGAHLLELHRFPSLDSTGQLRVGVSIDELPPVVVASQNTDEHRGTWADAVVANGEKLYLRLPYLDAGAHLLHLHAIDEYVAFSALVVYTTSRPASTLAPPPSHRTGHPVPDPVDPDPATVDLRTVEAVCRDTYQVKDLADLPAHPVVYIDAAYWDQENTFVRNTIVPQATVGRPRRVLGPDGSKDVLRHLPAGPFVARDATLALEAESALADTAHAWLSPSLDEPVVGWTHTQSETDAGTGLAMHVDTPRRRWDTAGDAPGMHYRIVVDDPGTYHVWLLVRFTSGDDDACVLALDGVPQPPAQQWCGGDMYSFGTQQIWVWQWLSDLKLDAGPHTLSLLARKSRLRVDRIWLSTVDTRPPADASWTSTTGGR